MDATVSNYCTWLSNGEADLTECQQFYNDVVADLARPRPALVNFAPLSSVSGSVTVPYPAIDLMLVFYNNFQLGELTVREANWVDPDWSDTVSTPTAGTYNYVTESFTARSFQLVEAPSLPFAHDCFVIYSETRQTLPVWLQLPVACLILYHEFSRESDHKELNLADAFRALGQALLALALR